MDTSTFLSTLASTLISITATWFFAWLYYKRAGDEMQRETSGYEASSMDSPAA